MLIDLNNKKLESDIGVDAEMSEKKSSQLLVLTSTECSEQKGDPAPMNPQTECSLYKISDCI